ncbi:GH12 family glycosyl hydrolase domain-containing protein [Actinopolymorpha alba]|uniref:GH12 family glycosyl hydrolase domain-containing protein n=1 Tax=Actinopolymorpha alba TaxID=533267 RepID=UPI00035DAB1F|nr:hypothetical protein [Actinopolymorpha alba]
MVTKHDGRIRRLRAFRLPLLAISLLAVLGGSSLAGVPSAQHAREPVPAGRAPAVTKELPVATLCGSTQRKLVDGSRYAVLNNVWGATTAQCIRVQGRTFTVARTGHNKPPNGPNAANPTMYTGCHFGACTISSGLPRRLSNLQVTSNWHTTQPRSGTWNVAYDMWLHPAPKPGSLEGGAEVMVWLNSTGGVQPAGWRVARKVRINGATWEVWYSPTAWQTVSYRRTSPVTSVKNLNLTAFLDDAAARYFSRSWYLIGVEAGFELWQGGQGLATRSFSVTVRNP